MDRKTADKWRPFLNVMARINMEIDVAETCLYEPTRVELGRKELYELKRDWRDELEFDAETGKVPLRVCGLEIVRADATEHLKLY